MNKRNVLNLIVGAALVVVFLLLLFTFQVRQSEVALVLTFGKPGATPITQPGLYFKWPWPIQRVYRFDSRVQNFEDKLRQTLTADNNNLILTVYVGWKISDASEFYPKFVGSVPAAQQALEKILATDQSSVVGKHTLSDFVNSDPKDLKFDEMEKAIQDAAQAELSTNNYGIQLEFLGFKKIELPESVTQSVFDRMKAERQKLISAVVNQGAREASIIKSDADRTAAETIANANATAKHIQGEGDAEAAKVLPTFQENPQLANYLLRLDALRLSLNQQTTLILDERNAPFDLFAGLPTNSPAQ
ncbi:MAG TPA: protease modulator HflC [Pseudomonadales bacterium]|nr:protease modulator HflC [Pseudomonadales bacterium]